jgi:hypothetical protein
MVKRYDGGGGVFPAAPPVKPKEEKKKEPTLQEILATIPTNQRSYYGYPVGVLHDNYRVMNAYSDYLPHPKDIKYPAHTVPQSSFYQDLIGYRYRNPALNGKLPNGQPDPTRQSTLPGQPLEAKPTHFYPRRVYEAARAVAQARNLGVPQLSAEDLAAIALKEGNHAGVGPFGLDSSAPYADFINPKTGKHEKVHDYSKVFVDEHNRLIRGYDPTLDWQRKYFDYMASHGMSEEGALMALKLMEKQRRAQTHGSDDPVSQWLGSGVSRNGETAAEYMRAMKKFRMAARLPQNKALVEYIRQALEDGKAYEIPAYPTADSGLASLKKKKG